MYSSKIIALFLQYVKYRYFFLCAFHINCSAKCQIPKLQVPFPGDLNNCSSLVLLTLGPANQIMYPLPSWSSSSGTLKVAHKTITAPLSMFYSAPTFAKAHEVTLGLRNIKHKLVFRRTKWRFVWLSSLCNLRQSIWDKKKSKPWVNCWVKVDLLFLKVMEHFKSLT